MQAFQPGRTAGRSLACAIGRSFSVTTLIALPVGCLGVFELTQDLPGGDVGLLLLLVAPLLLLPFAIGAPSWAADGWAAVRWTGRAAAHYAAYYLTPVALLAPLPALAGGGTVYGTGLPGSPLEEYLQIAGITALLIGAPALAALLMVAPWASRGRNARLPLALLANIAPAFVLVAGGLPAVLVIAAHTVFACRVIRPAAARQPAGPAPAAQPGDPSDRDRP
ncbi:hypothetical protein ACFPZF_17810 [Kitasatospora cinereorecta]|uniref:Uncharacterized protein n=1 Tax=Kitasatospora cinereorecta TaxID=285560 RepID=A0ABW0VCU8_9ACTN